MTLIGSPQEWKDRAYCADYAATCNISLDDIHYGWLAAGENQLGLINDLKWDTATVLDLGCGMGENLIAMNAKGATCFGIDISPFMLKYAGNNAAKAQHPQSLFFQQEDMRNLERCFSEISFDLVLSVYSMEYLKTTDDLRKVMTAIYNRLHPGALFVFCFSHPLQHFMHRSLRNSSGRNGDNKSSPLIYSFFDVIRCLDDVGFTIDRIVEQETQNPSQITFEDSLQYPYRFHNSKNPCKPEFDHLSNQSPHTCIYKVRKPAQEHLEKQGKFDATYGTRTLWRETRTIKDIDGFFAGTSQYYIEQYEQPFDDILGSCEIINIEVTKECVTNNHHINLFAFRRNRLVDTSIQANSILGIVHSNLSNNKLHPLYYETDFTSPASLKSSSEIYMQRIDPIYSHISQSFPGCYLGLLLFINGEEPANGKVNLTSFVPKTGDRIQLMYVVGKTKDRKRHIKKLSPNQMYFFFK